MNSSVLKGALWFSFHAAPLNLIEDVIAAEWQQCRMELDPQTDERSNRPV